MKKTVTLKVPLWMLLLIALVLIAGICTWVFLSHRNPDQTLLSDLSPEDIQSVTFFHNFHGEKALNPEQIQEMVALLSQVTLSGEPWYLHIVGGGSVYTVYTKDGGTFSFSLTPATGYNYYTIDDRRYVAFTGEEAPPEVYRQLEDLMEKHRQELWSEDTKNLP